MAKKQSWLMVFAVVSLAGCGSATSANPTISLRYEKALELHNLESMVRRAGPGPVAVVDLGRTAWVSEHIVVVREGEAPHYHRFHDLTITVMRGEGVMDVEGRRFTMKAGDVAHINRGVRHYFRNTSRDPSAAFVVFSPPFDGRDTVTAEVPAEELPAEEPKRPWWKLWGSHSPKVDEAHPTGKPGEKSP